MSHSLILGLKEPENLTGRVTVDKTEEEFWGNYSCVYLSRYGNELVAAKVIQRTGNSASMKRKVRREMTVWASTNHPNILPFYGFADDEEFAPFGALISPWCARGDASRYMREHGNSMLLHDRIKLWKSVIQGVIYLHEHEPVIIHGDLKPGNILIDESGNPLICDFGLARIFLEEGHSDLTTSSEHTGTARYLAPELVISDTSVYPTMAGDVYALGCLGLEFIYFRKPYANRENNLRGQIYVDIRNGLPPAANRPPHIWPSCRLWVLISQMWNPNPLFRPSAFVAEPMLERISLTLPPPVIGRLVHFVANILGRSNGEVSNEEWAQRCDLLRSLCLVSKQFMAHTLPLLYGKIRLRLTPGRSKLSMLLATLAQSKHRDPSSGRGSFTTTLIIVVPSRETGMLFKPSPVEVWDLFRMMPGLQSVVVSGRDEPPRYSLISHSMTTLELQGRDIPLLLEEEFSFQLLAFVQKLSILCDTKVPSRSGYLEAPLHLPNLYSMSIVGLKGTGPGYIGEILVRINSWSMPRLTSFQIDALNFSAFDMAPTTAFLRKHGHSIQYLMLMCGSTNYTISLPEVLQHCPSLRVLKSTSGLRISRDLSPHLALQRLILQTSKHTGSIEDIIPYLRRIEEFKDASSTLIPNLQSAEILWTFAKQINGRWRTGFPASATIEAGVSYIKVVGYHEERIMHFERGKWT